jgi:hypothetical protein
VGVGVGVGFVVGVTVGEAVGFGRSSPSALAAAAMPSVKNSTGRMIIDFLFKNLILLPFKFFTQTF